MTVAELIEELKQYNPDHLVWVWDPYDDKETDNVQVTEDGNGPLISVGTSWN